MSRKLSYMIFSLACFVAIGVCIIVDLAVNGQMGWSWLPLVSVPFGWALASPFWLRRHGLLVAVCALTVLALPYLYLMAALTAGGRWFCPMGLPLGLLGIAAAWVTYWLLKLRRVSMWVRIAVGALLACAVATPLANYCVSRYVQQPLPLLNVLSSVFLGVLSAAVLCIIGYVRSEKKPGGPGGKQ